VHSRLDFECAPSSRLTARLADAGARNAKELARATLLLMEGTMLLVLIHNDPSYASTAEMAAIALVKEKF
jgi:hypothetical protein